MTWTQLEPDEGTLAFEAMPFELHVTIIRDSAVAWWCDVDGFPCAPCEVGEA